jgi:aspartate/methionine/tyrosine aminotransferase
MPLKVAQRAHISPFIVMEVMRAAAQREAGGEGVLHLEVGQPSTGAPRGAVLAAKAALDSDTLGYTLALGLEPLRQRIARHYREAYGVSVSPHSVVVTTGSSAAFLLAFLAAFDLGDRVGILAPGYPCYRNILNALGVVPVPIPVGPDTGFQPDIGQLDAGKLQLDGLVIASPANPTGSMLDSAALSGLAAWCGRNGVRLVSDEIYHGITYGRQAATAAGIEGVIAINSFSKYYSMTGWRLGWMIVPDMLLPMVERLAQNFAISPPTLSQHAALAAFECTDELDANVARYARNRDILVATLPGAGFDKIAPPDGAFYLYADISRFTNDSEAFCRRMLTEIGVATTPGVDFDQGEGQRFLRMSYSGATEDMITAAKRLRAWSK